MQRVGILYHPLVNATQIKATQIQDFLDGEGLAAWRCSSWEPDDIKAQLDGTDLILTVGGDGTILRTVQAVFPREIPITGINMGKLGFLTELGADEALEKLPALLSGKGWRDQRSMLAITLEQDKEAPQTFTALNDVVAARGAIARLVHLAVTIDSQHFQTYRADGVIVATATGSTGYSLAAGGPILHPQSPDLILVPIAPHLSPAYPLVLPGETLLKLKITTFHEATLSIDGHINLALGDGAEISVSRSQRQAQLLRIHTKNLFYSSLEQKLRGKKSL
ncbi:NAD(+)/NADH kinase [Chloroflexota bacterium]